MIPAPTFLGVQTKTVVRFIEGWIVTFVAAFAGQVTVGGQALDLFTPQGRTSAATAVIAAVLLALRRYSSTP